MDTCDFSHIFSASQDLLCICAAIRAAGKQEGNKKELIRKQEENKRETREEDLTGVFIHSIHIREQPACLILLEQIPATDIIIPGFNSRDTGLPSPIHDLIEGLGGADYFNRRGGPDEVLGGEGDDTLLGDAGLDTLEGNGGNGLFLGGIDRDTLIGGEGNDTLLGEDDDDELDGGAAPDYLGGGAGVDRLAGGRSV